MNEKCRLEQGDGGTVKTNDRSDLVRVAVLDFDGTVARGQSGSLLSTYLWRHGFISPRRTIALAWWGIRYKLGLPQRQDEARELVFGALAGHDAEEVDRILSSFYAEVMSSRIRPAAIREVARLHEDGCKALLVSATFDVIAREAARTIGADGYIATEMERDDRGYYTGRVHGTVVEGAEKVWSSVRWCDAHYGPGAWEFAYAYGDHRSDLGILSVAHEGAFAVCPHRAMASLSRARGWQIVDWDEEDGVGESGACRR
mgnify:FL=1